MVVAFAVNFKRVNTADILPVQHGGQHLDPDLFCSQDVIA
jgi:hypothetical protein